MGESRSAQRRNHSVRQEDNVNVDFIPISCLSSVGQIRHVSFGYLMIPLREFLLLPHSKIENAFAIGL